MHVWRVHNLWTSDNSEDFHKYKLYVVASGKYEDHHCGNKSVMFDCICDLFES